MVAPASQNLRTKHTQRRSFVDKEQHTGLGHQSQKCRWARISQGHHSTTHSPNSAFYRSATRINSGRCSSCAVDAVRENKKGRGPQPNENSKAFPVCLSCFIRATGKVPNSDRTKDRREAEYKTKVTELFELGLFQHMGLVQFLVGVYGCPCPKAKRQADSDVGIVRLHSSSLALFRARVALTLKLCPSDRK